MGVIRPLQLELPVPFTSFRVKGDTACVQGNRADICRGVRRKLQETIKCMDVAKTADLGIATMLVMTLPCAWLIARFCIDDRRGGLQKRLSWINT